MLVIGRLLYATIYPDLFHTDFMEVCRVLSGIKAISKKCYSFSSMSKNSSTGLSYPLAQLIAQMIDAGCFVSCDVDGIGLMVIGYIIPLHS